MELTPDAVIRDIHDCLIRGANSRRSPAHTPVVATADGDMRVMVLRAYDPATATLRFHTDARSPKVAAVEDNSAASVLVYDPETKVQIRMRGVARIERTSDAAEDAWRTSTNFARRCYLTQAAPGSPSAEPVSGLPGWAEGVLPSDEDIAPARENFAILLIRVFAFDWLYLAHAGHRRATVTLDEAGATGFCWVVP